MTDTNVEQLEERIGRLEKMLEEKLDALEGLNASAEGLPKLELDKYELNENEKRVLTLLSIGLPKGRASQAAGMSASYATMRLKDSIEFATAYKDIEKRVRQWAEARLSFTLPAAWKVLDRILAAEPEEYLDGNTSYARALLQAQEKVAKQIIRLDVQKDATLTVEHRLDDPLLQVQERSLDIIARQIESYRERDKAGLLQEGTPEWRVLEAEVEEVSQVIGGQPVNYDDCKLKCLECGDWVKNLHSHVYNQHEMGAEEYKKKHNITVSQRLDFDSFIEHQAYLKAGDD